MSTPDEPAPTQAGGPLRAQAGLVLGERYELLTQLGRGGTAEVWRARDTLLARDVAIKVFHHDSAIADAEVRRSGEVRLLAGLSHPGLVAVFDAGGMSSGSGSETYLVMELVDGESLHRRLEAGPLPALTVCEIGQQLATTLAYLHDHRVVHRDIKPANILLATATHGPLVKLTDFGIARLLDSSRLTVDGATVGTPNYLSPEQVLGRDVGPASDVYTLGLVLLEALTGRLCYPGHGIEAALARLHHAPAVPAHLEPAWHELLPAMTAQDPAARPRAQHVADVLCLIASGARPTQLLGAVPTPATQTLARPAAADAVPGRAPDPGRPRRRSAALVAALAAAAAVVALVLILATGADPTAPQTPAPAAGSTTAPPDRSSPPSRTPAGGSSKATTPAAGNVPVVASSTRHAGDPQVEISLPVPRATKSAPTARRPGPGPGPRPGEHGTGKKPKPRKKP